MSCAGELCRWWARGLPFFMVFYGILWYFMVFYGISNLREIEDNENERASTDVRLGEGKHFDLRAHP